MSGCVIEEDPPKAGPNGSWWVGGLDGGVFLKVTDDGNPNDLFYHGVIYFESDKTVWYKGQLKLVGDTSFSPEDKDRYEGWDGERLHLKNGVYLEATQPIPAL